MKKKVIIALFICLCSLASIVYAEEEEDRSYYIENFNTDLYLEEDGDVTYENEITYSFDGKFNGVYRTVYFHRNKKDKGISPDSSIYNADGIIEDSVQIKSISHYGEEKIYKRSKNAQPGTYNIIEEKGGYTYKIYMPISDSTATVNFKYTLDNMFVTHKDVSELYTGLFEDNSKVEKARLKIHYPSRVNTVEKLEVFCHTTANYKTKRDEYSYTVEVDGIKAYQAFDIRLVADKSIINSDRKSNLTAKPLIRDLEEYLEKEPATYVSRKNMMKKILYINIVFLILSIIRYLKIFNKYEKEPEVKEKLTPSMEVPNKNRNPFEIKLIETCGQQSVDTQVVLSGIFYLINKGYLKLNTNKILNKKGEAEYDYELEIVKKCTKEKEYIKSLVELFFGEKTKINLKKRLKEIPKSTDDYEKIMKIWEKALKTYKDEYEVTKVPKEEKDNYIVKILRRIFMVLATILLILSPRNTVLLYNKDILGLVLNIPIVLILALFLTGFAVVAQIIICEIHKKNDKNILFCILTALHSMAIIGITSFFDEITNCIGSGLYVSIIALYILIVTAFFSISSTRKQKDEIAVERAKWKNLKAYIKKYSYLEDKELAHIITWEEYMTYGIIFGLARKVKKEVELVYETKGDSFMIYHYMNCNMTMSKSLAASQSNYIASTSSGGGFSGGGGGGCGGGGGAF